MTLSHILVILFVIIAIVSIPGIAEVSDSYGEWKNLVEYQSS